MSVFPYARLARAFGPRPTHTIEARGHRFIPYGEVEMLCRPCGFVIWEVDDEDGAAEALAQLGGTECPYAGSKPLVKTAKTGFMRSTRAGSRPESVNQERKEGE